MKLPSFIVIGAPKCGTTSLYHYLNQHPDIFLARKEVHYFVRNVAKYADVVVKDWPSYLKLFSDADAAQTLGEVAVRYIYSHDALVEIREKVPDVKIIIMLRNPVDRAFSHYLMRFRTGGYSSEGGSLLPTPVQIERAFDNHRKDYMAMSDYAQVLAPWYEQFEKHRIKIILLEEMRDNPKLVMRDLFNFLQVEPDIEIDTSRQFNVSTVKEFNPKLVFLKKIKILRALRNNKTLRKAVTYLVPRKTLDRLQWREGAKSPHVQELVQLPESTRKNLEKHFSATISRLETMTGVDLAIWDL